MMEDLLESITTELKSHGLNVSIKDNAIIINVIINHITLELRCVLGDYFPYEFPTVTLSDESTRKIPKIPHIYTDNSICAFDKGVVIPNFKHPVSLACETIYKAIEILQKGICKENQEDFIDEFCEYWEVSHPKGVVAFIEDYTVFKEVYFISSPTKSNGPTIVADTHEHLADLYFSINYKRLLPEDVYTGILIPLDIGSLEYIPKNDFDIYRLIEHHSSNIRQYERYVQHHIDDNVHVIIAYPSPKGTILFGWTHFMPGVPNGFRRGHVNLKVLFSQKPKQTGAGFSLINCSQTRLFSRGGDGHFPTWKKVCIVGCGSVGSILANSLMYSGAKDFTLVDNEPLSYENIARHCAGYSYVGFSKVIAIEHIMRMHNPNIVCSPMIMNAHKFFDTQQEIINSSDVLFVATASIGIEHHLCELINQKMITTPSVIMWLEPYAIGGHAILLKNPQNLYEELFDSCTLEFTHKIVANSNELYKRENGCQSTYVPYSGFYLQMFVTRLLEIISTRTINQTGNYLITWFGRISNAQKYAVEICEEYKDAVDFSVIERRID